MAIRDTVSDAGAHLWRGIKWVGNKMRAKEEEPVTAARDWIKIVMSGLAIVALFLTWRQLGIQTNALRTQTEQLNIQKMAQRPWLKVGVPHAANAFPVGADGGAFAVDFDIKNFGISPALNVEVDAELPLMKSNMGAGAIQENICRRLRDRPTGDKGGGLTLFPQEGIPQRIVIPVRAGEVSKGAKTMGLSDQSFLPMMIGCIRYFSPVDELQHETAFAFYVSHRPPNTLLMTENGDVPPEQIVFIAPTMLNSRIN